MIEQTSSSAPSQADRSAATSDSPKINRLDTTYPASSEWQRLPARAQTMFVLTTSLASLLIAILALIPIGLLIKPVELALALAACVLLALPLMGIWLARKQYRYTTWKWDAVGFSLRRGRLWHSEICVPATRVQHLDLKHGPIERRFGLATLLIHTAGTRDHAVSIVGLDALEAERLRNGLAHQVEENID